MLLLCKLGTSYVIINNWWVRQKMWGTERRKIEGRSDEKLRGKTKCKEENKRLFREKGIGRWVAKKRRVQDMHERKTGKQQVDRQKRIVAVKGKYVLSPRHKEN